MTVNLCYQLDRFWNHLGDVPSGVSRSLTEKGRPTLNVGSKHPRSWTSAPLFPVEEIMCLLHSCFLMFLLPCFLTMISYNLKPELKTNLSYPKSCFLLGTWILIPSIIYMHLFYPFFLKNCYCKKHCIVVKSRISLYRILGKMVCKRMPSVYLHVFD